MRSIVPIAAIIPPYNQGWQFSPYWRNFKMRSKAGRNLGSYRFGERHTERELNQQFPNVGVLTSPIRLGLGG